MATATARLARPRMNLWRLEWLRLIRTPRALALGAVFVFFGLLEPVLTRYQSQVFQHGGTGLIVVVVVAAGAFTFDSRHGLATFLRTRITSFWQLLAPRFAVNAAAAAIGYLLGTLAAWFETDLLIGAPPAGAMLGGMLCGAVYLAYAVAVTALAATIVRGTLGTVGIALGALFLLPI